MAHVHSLPLEILHMILAYFADPTNDVGFAKFDPTFFQIACVCKRWLTTAHDLLDPGAAAFWSRLGYDEVSRSSIHRIIYMGRAKRSCLRVWGWEKRKVYINDEVKKRWKERIMQDLMATGSQQNHH